MLVKIEEVNAHRILTQKVIQRAVGIKATVNVEVIHRFDGDIPWLTLVSGLIGRRKLKGIVRSAKPTRIK